jgi:hypothetical protein
VARWCRPRLLAQRSALAPEVAKWHEYQARQQQLSSRRRSLLLTKQELLGAQLEDSVAQVRS